MRMKEKEKRNERSRGHATEEIPIASQSWAWETERKIKKREKKQSFVCDNGNDDCYFNGISLCQLIKQEDIQQAHRLTTTATKANWIQNGISFPVHTIHNYLLLLLVFFSPSMSRCCYCSVCCYHRRKNFKLTLHQRWIKPKSRYEFFLCQHKNFT